MNRFPLWKYILLIVVVIAGFLYAAPILFVEDPAIQIVSNTPSVPLNETTLTTVEHALQTAQLPYKKIQFENNALLVRFTSTDVQFKAKEIIQHALGNDFLIAFNLATTTPNWLRAIGAQPMKLGLDLRGGVHFLLEVDVDTVLKQRIEGDLNNFGQELRNKRIRYIGIQSLGGNKVLVRFREQRYLDDAANFLTRQFPEFTWTKNNLILEGILSPNALTQIRQETLEQTMTTLRHRVNELGVSEAVVQQQGASRIAVDLPGIQDTAQAKNVIGKVATLELHMVDVEHDARNAATNLAPPDTKLYYENGQPVLLKNQIILKGSSITSATSGIDDTSGKPAVFVRLGGGSEALFTKTTAENVGKPMAVLYVEVKSEPKTVNGKTVIDYQTERRIISVAIIQQALGNSFQITGLTSPEEARMLALLLRAGALPATVSFIEERQIGPSLGKQNIHMGVLSVEVGFVLVVIFMALYYGVMGIIADIVLGMNLVLIIAILSILGATLTLPGIAGIVLTVGMAVDANVLIFERIREELRNGVGIQASIYAGYERAFVTIVDANITTLIVAIVLFSLGSGTVKNFAVTLTIGLFTSMFTAIMGSRALVNLLYGHRSVKHISIGSKYAEISR